MRALVTGWFSFPGMGATAGDLLARDVVCDWLDRAGYPYDVANSSVFGGQDWRSIDPLSYSDLVFVCGPLGNGGPIPELLERFAHCRKVGIDLTMLHELKEWNPFDVLWERDSNAMSRPDIAFLAEAPRVPVVGIVLVRRQKEYAGGAHMEAGETIFRIMNSRDMAAIHIDTCLDPNRTGLRTAAEVEATIARMDVVLTTRLHGLVLALKNEVPVLAIDPIAGGAKVSRQAEVLGWPLVYKVGETSDAELAEAFERCLTDGAALARECRDRAQKYLQSVREEFSSHFRHQAVAARTGEELHT